VVALLLQETRGVKEAEQLAMRSVQNWPAVFQH